MRRSPRLQVRIGRVTLAGVAPMRAEAVREALEAALRRRNLPGRLADRTSGATGVARVNAGVATLRSDAGPASLAACLARAIDAALPGDGRARREDDRWPAEMPEGRTESHD